MKREKSRDLGVFAHNPAARLDRLLFDPRKCMSFSLLKLQLVLGIIVELTTLLLFPGSPTNAGLFVNLCF